MLARNSGSTLSENVVNPATSVNTTEISRRSPPSLGKVPDASIRAMTGGGKKCSKLLRNSARARLLAAYMMRFVSPPANQRGGLIAAHDLANALECKTARTAVIIEQHLVPGAVEPDVGSAAVVEGGDQGLAEAQLIALRGRGPDVIGGEIAQRQGH